MRAGRPREVTYVAEDWPWTGNVVARMTDDEHARWRARSMALAAEALTDVRRKEPDRKALTGRELIACDRQAAIEVIGEPSIKATG